MSPGADVLIVSLGSTAGLRAADEELASSLTRAGARVRVAPAPHPPALRTLALTDLSWALAARRAASTALREHRPRAVLYSSTTAALLGPRPGAVRFDAPARANRPGRHGLWQRPAESELLSRAPLLVPWSEGGLEEAGPAAIGRPAIIVPMAVERSGEEPAGGRDIAAITYAANPAKKGLDRVLAAWHAVRRPGEELLVTGSDAAADHQEGVRLAGVLPPNEYRALLRRSRLFVCAPRREDYGIAQLEALADGCRLVSTPAPGPYVALPLARALDPRLVDEDLERALRAAREPDPGYGERAARALEPFARPAVDRLVAERLLVALLAGHP